MQKSRNKVTTSISERNHLCKNYPERRRECRAYTRVNWIAIGEHALKGASEADLKYLVAHELFHLLTRQNSNFKKGHLQGHRIHGDEKEIIFPSDLAEIRISNPDPQPI